MGTESACRLHDLFDGSHCMVRLICTLDDHSVVVWSPVPLRLPFPLSWHDEQHGVLMGVHNESGYLSASMIVCSKPELQADLQEDLAPEEARDDCAFLRDLAGPSPLQRRACTSLIVSISNESMHSGTPVIPCVCSQGRGHKRWRRWAGQKRASRHVGY